MLQLTYANRTECLVERLAAQIQADRAADLWEPILMVVPNPFMKEHLQQQLASRLGIAAHIRYTYLNNLWRDLFRQSGIPALTSQNLRLGLLCALSDPQVLAPDFMASVRRYLQDDSGDLKRVQLATELARLFEEYHYSRPEWIQRW
ncbi:MAG: exodeoxyribonuclease V subunit gamma, partial [Firmicutes bacterium]|nr:exodeoxyribonuclease V subunit gamma [Bacillota bacterium]